MQRGRIESEREARDTVAMVGRVERAEIGGRVTGMMLHHQSAGKHQLNTRTPAGMS